MLLPRSRRLGETDIGIYVLSTAKVRFIFQREKSKLLGFVLQTQYIAFNFKGRPSELALSYHKGSNYLWDRQLGLNSTEQIYVALLFNQSEI